jgi:hypothetical protein
MHESPATDPHGPLGSADEGEPKVAQSMGWLVALLGAIMLAGWIADLPVLRSPVPGQVEVKANTAIAFLLSGLVLALHRRVWFRPFARFVAGGTALGSLLVLLQYPMGADFGVDE